MCDTAVALRNSTRNGEVLFAKNSDRDVNEAHHVMLVPAEDFKMGSTLRCTYVEIPQVAHTHAVLLAKPFWIWGAEMGANEHGVVIGNEAVFTREPYGTDPGLIGMDYLRLGLERGSTALQALEVMTSLLEAYGQSGNCGFSHPFYYNNSFLIADRQEAWVLETVGRRWAAVKVQDVRSISNALTIGEQWDLGSADLEDYARKRGWWKRGGDFHFARAYSDFLYTRFSDAGNRRTCTTDALLNKKGDVSAATMIDLLRSHHTATGAGWSPDAAITGADVCMHAGFGPIRGSQSTGSLVSSLSADEHLLWVTGTSAPCTGIFKPVWMDAGLADLGAVPGGVYDTQSDWWQHERLHRAVLKNHPGRLAAYRAERDTLEAEFLTGSLALRGKPAADRLAYSAECFRRARAAEAGWLKAAQSVAPRSTAFYYQLAWNGFNRQAGLPED